MSGFFSRMFGKGGAGGAPLVHAPAFALTPGTRVYAIGDIHGRADLLQTLLHRIEADAKGFKGRKVLLSIGDIIDRGPDSAGAVSLLATPRDGWDVIYLRGNHEQALLDFLTRPKQSANWLAWGGVQALQSYGITPFGAKGIRDPEALAAELEMALTERDHLTFYPATRLSHIEGEVLFVHAGVRPGIALERQMVDDLLFIRDDFMGRPHALPYRVVFGHTILPDPLLTPDRVGIDTGAYHSGVLTAAVLEGTEVRFLQAHGEPL